MTGIRRAHYREASHMIITSEADIAKPGKSIAVRKLMLSEG